MFENKYAFVNGYAGLANRILLSIATIFLFCFVLFCFVSFFAISYCIVSLAAKEVYTVPT